jgi:hypothetical protein
MIPTNIFKDIIRSYYNTVVDTIDGVVLGKAEYDLEVKRRVYAMVNPANNETAAMFNKLYDEIV